jgi:DNA-binding CsgD family transcriptional regulator
MMTRVQLAANEAISQLRKAGTHFELSEALARLGAMMGAQYFQLIPGPKNPLNNSDSLLGFGNYPSDILEYYANEQNALSDPCRNIAIFNPGIIIWRKVFAAARGRKEREFITKMRESGVKDGLSLPIYGPEGCLAILNYGSVNFLDLVEDDDEALLLVAMVAYQRIKQFLAKALLKPRRTIQLSGREVECLRWVIEGKTNWEIGVLMGISPRTVQFHIANCQNKLGANNRIHTVAKALVNNIIKPKKDDDIIYLIETKGTDTQRFKSANDVINDLGVENVDISMPFEFSFKYWRA